MTDRFFYLKIKQAGRIQRPRQTKQGGRTAPRYIVTVRKNPQPIQSLFSNSTSRIQLHFLSQKIANSRLVQRTGQDKTNETRLVSATATTCRGPTRVAAIRNAGTPVGSRYIVTVQKKSATNTILIFKFNNQNTAAFYIGKY